MAKYEVPENVLDKLKCGLCFEYLSHPPITLYAESGSVCGRCPVLESEKNVQPLREQSYESCASLFTFPCRYRSHGCMDRFTMKQMPLHEPSCSFKPYFCPIMPLGSCMWQGAPSELHGHFAMSHQIMLLEHPVFELDLVNNYKEHYLIPMIGQLFLLRTEFNAEEGEFCCSLHMIGSRQQAENYMYEIQILPSDSVNDKGNACTLVKKQVDVDVNILERITYSTFSLDTLRSMFDEASNIICQVKISLGSELKIQCLSLEDEDESEYESEEENCDTVQVKSKLGIDDPANKMLFDIECPVCQEFMIPPIYQCIVGHSVCGVCKPKLKECPTCREKIGNTRNFTLEKITENLVYHCRNRFEGCSYTTSSADIRQHETICLFKPQKCPFDELNECDWMGNIARIMEHCKLKHEDAIQKDPFHMLPYFENCDSEEHLTIMQLFGDIFRLRFSYSNANKLVSCTVQCYGTSNDAAKYMYHIHLIDLNNTGRQLTSRKYCGSICDEIHDVVHCTLWHIDMVKPFLSNDNFLKFKCIIQKV